MYRVADFGLRMAYSGIVQLYKMETLRSVGVFLFRFTQLVSGEFKNFVTFKRTNKQTNESKGEKKIGWKKICNEYLHLFCAVACAYILPGVFD